MRISPVAVRAISTPAMLKGRTTRSPFLMLTSFAYFIDHAHNFVTDNGAFFQRSASVLHMKIAAAYAAGSDS